MGMDVLSEDGEGSVRGETLCWDKFQRNESHQ